MQPANASVPARRRFRLRFDFWTAVTAVSLLICLVFLIYPLFHILVNSFVQEGRLDLSHYETFFKYKYYYSALLNSFIVSSVTTVLACLIGVPLAYVMTRYNVPCKGLIQILIILTLMSPPFIGAYSWILLLGNNGFLTQLFSGMGLPVKSIYGLHGMILAFTMQYYPHIYLYVSGALKSVDASLEEASASLGVYGWRRVMKITLPLIFPTLSTGALMVFMASFSDFGTPMLLGQGVKLLPVLAYEEFISEMGTDPAMASTISMVLLAITTSLLGLQRYMISKKSYAMSMLRPPAVRVLKLPARVLATAFVALIVGVSMIPQATVIITSFQKRNGPVLLREFSLDSYKEILYRVPRSILNTFTFSSVAIVLMIILGLLMSYVIVRRKSRLTALLDSLLMIPYVMPGTVMGISLIIAFNKPPIVLTGTWVILVVAYVIRKLPYTIRSSTAILYQVDKSVEEASLSLGVPPMKTFFRTTAMLMLPGVMSGAVLSWITTINELSSTIVLYYGATATITVTIYGEVINANFGPAAALSSILSVSTVISLVIANKLSRNRGLRV
ncbi:iron ABC transporter permease [Paenibacillus filicis]|uniref:Iron ABC transporter permease n=1 Tax=Paenibacillus filicis TaxID=669464 RepID=A0ABU9DCG3_9BACL